MAKYKMADDFDDGDKGKVEKEDSAYFTQFENVINEIKSQLHTTNPAELARLNSAISSLLASDLPTKILKSLEALQAAVAKEEQRAEQNMRYSQEEKSREAVELQNQVDFLEKEAERLEAKQSAQFHQESIKLKEQHTEFNKNADAYLTARKNWTNQLHDVVKDLKDGKDVESELQKLVKSEDQIKKQNTEYKNLLEHRDKTHEHYDGVMKHNEKLKAEKVRLEKEAEKEKQKPKEIHSPSVFEEVTQKIKHQDKKITDFAPVVAQAQKQKDEVDAKVQEMKEEHKDFVKEMGDFDELIKQLQQTDPVKHNKLSKFTTLLKNQEEAVTGNGIVNDTLLRSEFTDKTKNAENLEPEIAGTNLPSSPSKLTEIANDKTPQDSKTIDQEQDKTPPTNLNKTLKDESRKLGNKMIQKLGYDDQVTVMNQVSEKHLDQHITKGLSEAKPVPLKPVPTPNPKFTTLHKDDKQR
ncbi:hypothetical protein [Candidatus Tisiphia endosymbiont of Micropterix aruncella]|uniref:hypothetical protein n=1 Tax=Candidatus Tisiphia endosymbiont of Micropterix aruncella TaxID=3066271 RepID=UPI003AA7ABC2